MDNPFGLGVETLSRKLSKHHGQWNAAKAIHNLDTGDVTNHRARDSSFRRCISWLYPHKSAAIISDFEYPVLPRWINGESSSNPYDLSFGPRKGGHHAD